MLGTHVCQDGLIAAVNEATSCCLCSLLLTSPGETPSGPHFPACTSTWINPREARWITKSSVRLSSSSPPPRKLKRARTADAGCALTVCGEFLCQWACAARWVTPGGGRETDSYRGSNSTWMAPSSRWARAAEHPSGESGGGWGGCTWSLKKSGWTAKAPWRCSGKNGN